MAVTVAMMLVEIVAGLTSQSMALLADGLHMASHTVAFAVTLFAYRYARRHAKNPKFTFGTGKVNALGGFTGAITLNLFALWMALESVERFIGPSEVHYSQAIGVAAIGLAVNGGSALLLRDHHTHSGGCSHRDHNLRSAYLHVLADAATSVAAILALILSQRLGLTWLDPLAGILGALVIISWSVSLLRDSASILLDHEGPARLQVNVFNSIKNEQVEIADWHCWAIGSGHYAAILSVNARTPITAREIRSRIPGDPSLVHLTIEINERDRDCAPSDLEG
jgi:cation diffusion facilitator family transporter